jgi:HEAT repeat protein
MESKKNIPVYLRGGDRRSIGRSNQAAALAAKNPEIFEQLIEALWHADPVVRMRAADAAEKASLQQVELLNAFKLELLGLLAETQQQELRWHLAQMVPRLRLTREERHRAASDLRRYLQDKSSIVRTFAMQALADLSAEDAALRVEVLELVRHLTKTGSPAMKARGRKLLKQLEKQ